MSESSGVADPFLQGERDTPAGLLRLFGMLSLASVAAVLVLAGAGFYTVVNGEMIRVAEQWAVYIGNTIHDQDRAIFFEHPIAKDRFAVVDARMKKFLISFNMFKIKAFSADKTIIYSTDHKLIGKIENDNPKLDQVLTRGVVVSKLEHREKLRDLKDEERFSVDFVECYVPVRSDGAIVGAFEVYVDITSTRERIVSATWHSILVLAAVLMLVFGLLYVPMRKGTLGLKKAHAKLAELASLDALTGIFNRRFLLDRVSAERDRMLREKHDTRHGHMALVMADIDHFKKVNDTYGHLAGDAVLREVSLRLRSSLRSYDVLGRYGGEEFLVMLPNTDLEQALAVARRMHLAVGSRPVMCDGQELTVTVSIGVADMLDTTEDPEQVIRRADESLYAAKNSGRNRVCFAPAPRREPASAANDSPATAAQPGV